MGPIRDINKASQHAKTGNSNTNEDNNLKDSKQVENAASGIGEYTMQAAAERQAQNGDRARLRLSRVFNAQCKQNVNSKGVAITGRDAQDDGNNCEYGEGKVPGVAVDPLEVVFVAAGFGDFKAKLEVDVEPGVGSNAA